VAGAVAAAGGRIGFGHVLHHGVAGGESADQQRALVADHGREPVVFFEGVGGGAGAGFLTESEIDAADDFALLIEIFERDFHFAVKQHEAVDLDGLPLVEIFRIADGWDGGVEIAGDVVADVVGDVFVFFGDLADREIGVLEAEVRDGVGAEMLVGACRAALDWTDEGVRPSTSCGGSRAVARAVAVAAGLGILSLDCHEEDRTRTRFSMLSQSERKELVRRPDRDTFDFKPIA
jgi:hypothetical protein